VKFSLHIATIVQMVYQQKTAHHNLATKSSESGFMDEMISKLMTILPLVNDWLKFAEAKNAILLAFSGAGITATITYLSAASNIPKSVEAGFLITTFLLCLCSFICSISFLPKTDLERILWKRSRPGRNFADRPTDNDNFYFFAHLYKYQETELIDAINRLYLKGRIKDLRNKEYTDLANQIIVNSEIAYLKFNIFSKALYFLIASIFSIPICIVLSLIIFHSI
jgi:hypothetical protein